MRSWCCAAFLPGEIDSIDIGVKAQATDGDGDVSTDGDGEGGLEEAKDWPRLRKLLDVDEKSRLFLDMLLGWQDFNCLLQWLCLRVSIFHMHDFKTDICSAIGNACQANQKELGSKSTLDTVDTKVWGCLQFLGCNAKCCFSMFFNVFDGFIWFLGDTTFDFMLICCDLTIWFSFCSFDWTLHTFGKGVRRCSDALLNVQDFLGRFLVKEFDHEAGCETFFDKMAAKEGTRKKDNRYLYLT